MTYIQGFEKIRIREIWRISYKPAESDTQFLARIRFWHVKIWLKFEPKHAKNWTTV